MNVLVACEFSGRVRDAFAAHGHYALSCDLLPSETSGNHYVGDVRRLLDQKWDLMVAHPPCTYLAASGARWHMDSTELRSAALAFVKELLDAPIPAIALENPVGAISTWVRKPDQIIQPWQFGHPEKKATCLWLKGLPQLTHTQVVEPLEHRVLWVTERRDRWKTRSRTLPGIAAAMAAQWGAGQALAGVV